MIEVKGLTRYYGEFAAISDVSFKVEKGEIIGLLGLNGAGKSTTLKILGGLMMPCRGTVTIDGVDAVDDPDALRSRIGYLPEEPPLYRDMTVTAFLRHIGRLKGMSRAQIATRLPKALEAADLGGREHQVIGTLSHGFMKRVGIAQAIIHDPKLVILDEPISGLDPAQIVGMRQVIRNLADGRAVMISSHILGEISQTCDRILVLHGGRLVAQGTEAELSRRSGSHRVVVTVRGSQDGLDKFLRAHAQVTRATAQAADPGLASAVVELAGDAREAVVADLVRAGFGIRLLEDPEDELEEIFLGLTKQEAA